MKNDFIVTIGLYFEITDSEMYGGKDSVGYANINVEIPAENCEKEKIVDYANAQIDGVAKMCRVNPQNVRIISRTEYEKNTEDSEEDDWDD